MDYKELYHTGVGHEGNPPGRGSGRYEWMSGKNPGQHQFTFRSEVNRLKKAGYSQSEIAAMLMGQKGVNKYTGEPIYYNSTDLRARIAREKTEEREINAARALELYDECHGNASEAARRMGIPESTFRNYLNPSLDERNRRYENVAEFLKKKIEEVPSGMIDISSGTELYIGIGEQLGVTDYTKKVAVSMLEQEGYIVGTVKIPTGPGKFTKMSVLAAPPGEGETVKDVYRRMQQNKADIQPIVEFSPDNGKTFWTPEFPESLDSKRIFIRYAEDGGKDKDGVIELRRGVEDISLDKSQYAQVRIAVDGTHYMKGMAIYGDVPDGYDVVYNTNKHRGTPMIDPKAVYNPENDSWSGSEVLKRMKVVKATGEIDHDNPFGALIKMPKDKDGVITAGGQRKYIGADGKEHLSPINKLQDEGDWDSWSRTLSSQFLSKQPEKLIKQQTDLSVKDKALELEKIMNLTNPVIKKKLLDDFAESCDANAADLSVKGFKNQAFQVLLPVPSLKETEVYAPNFKDGDQVALVRYPHGGIFEIPVLTVNNKGEGSSKAREIMKNAKDAIGINSKVAEQLSGADFDGDTALVIPLKSNGLAINYRQPLKGLVGFDPKELYKLDDSAPKMSNREKQKQMGITTNLITDMTVGGAKFDDITKAVKHSMVVIDAQKHHLNYKQSAKDNDIESLKEKYQKNLDTGKVGGASTILSRAKAKAHVPLRKEVTDTKKMTESELEDWKAGKKVYRNTGETKLKLIKKTSQMTDEELARYKEGKKIFRKTDVLKTTEVHQMDLVDDAMDLVRDKNNQKEVLYANYANNLKSLARQARIASRSIETIPVSAEAKKTYAAEVASLDTKLRIAKSNAPKERRAQALASEWVSEKLKSNPDMDFEHRKREQGLAITRARAVVGAKKEPINITDREWEAIQANAVSSSKLKSILENTNQDKFKQRATPKHSSSLSPTEIAMAQALLNASGGKQYTREEIANRLGVSTSTLNKALAA